MSHRLGTCTSCKAQYKVPASFQADRAKCKSCGGMVQIAPASGAAAPAKPAAPAAPVAAAKPVPARAVTSMPKPAPQPAQKPTPKPVAEEKPAVRAAAAAAAERVRTGAAEAAPSAKSSPSRSGAKERAGKRGARGGKEQSKAPMLAAVLLLLVAGGGGAWFFLRGGDEGPKTAESTGEVAYAPAANEASATEQAPAEVASAAATTQAPAEDAPPAEAAPTDAPPAAETPPAKPADEDVDLSVFPDEGKLPGTSDEDWAAIQEWTAAFLDANAGAAGNRARGKLFERGREAFPAMLNAMKRLDFSTEDGFRAGDLAQRFLMDVCKGTNFGWKYDRDENEALTPASVTFNKKVVRFWIKSWEQARDAPKAWAKLSKTTEEEALKLFAITGPFDAAAGAPAEAGASSSIDDL